MIFHLDINNTQLQAPLLLTTHPLQDGVEDAELAAQVSVIEPNNSPTNAGPFFAG